MLDITFTLWKPWADRKILPDQPGIYLIAKASSDNIIYVGRTWGVGGLRDRIRAFHRSASTGQKGHAGGLTYYGQFGPNVVDLQVSVHVPIAINPAEFILRPYLDFVEKRVIWENVQRLGRLPVCNSDAAPRGQAGGMGQSEQF